MNGNSNRVLEQVRSLCERIIGVEAQAVDRERRFPRRSVQSLADAGLFGLTIPQQFDGLGCGAEEFARVAGEIARVCGSTAMVYVMHVSGTMPIVVVGSEEQRTQLLPEIAAGRMLATLAFSEPGSGAHFYAPVSRAAANGAGFVLNCDKSFVPSAGEADLYLVCTGSPAGSTPLESDLFLVRRNIVVDWVSRKRR